MLELAQGQTERTRLHSTVRESERLSVQAALEQLDHLLHEHWEALDKLSRNRAGHSENVPAHRDGIFVWWVRGSVPVEQSPSEAILIAVE